MTKSEIEILEVCVRESLHHEGIQRIEYAVVKSGPRVYKTMSLMYLGRTPDDISKTELCFQSWNISRSDGDIDFTEKPTAQFRCEGDEITRVNEFLSAELGAEGRYRIISGDSPILNAIAGLSGDETLDSTEVVSLIELLSGQPDLGDLLAMSDHTSQLRIAAEVVRSRDAVDQLESLINDPASPERAFQELLEEHWWLLGGNYVDRMDRRVLTARDQLDLALVRTDGVLHVVELKRANIPRLVTRYRNHFAVGNDVNEAVNQAANYLREFDEQTTTIADSFGINCRRAHATVVIGHPRYVESVDQEDVQSAIRTYNSHLSRIDVVTYQGLLLGAQATLDRLEAELKGDITPGESSRTRPVDEAPF